MFPCLETLLTETRQDMFFTPTGDDSSCTYKGCSSSVNGFCFIGVLGEHKFIAAADQAGKVTVFDIETTEVKSQRSVSDLSAFGICSVDTMLYVGTANGKVVQLSVSASGQTKVQKTFDAHTQGNMWAVATHGDLRRDHQAVEGCGSAWSPQHV